ncbi:MAG: RusA family crossover junction endodeoxyribonuclease [Phascolarctobacterium sp.]|nr:RusA family crossover junction endodeoxyribonuclease [Phascolarctobacterium sp.]MBR5790231.1 RusA family crossover junction endodeoxyribonuclease [Phascolarctobacterium sp.]
MILSCGNKKLKFTVQGDPNSYHPVCYAERVIKVALEAMQEQHWAKAHRDMPVELTLIAYQEPPKSTARWKREAATHGLVPPLKQAHKWSAITQCTMDMLSNLAYEDSNQVFKVNYEARYSDEPKVEVELVGYFVSIGDVKAEVSKRNKRLVKSK